MDPQKPIISISGASDQSSKNDTANFMHDPSTRLSAKPSTSSQESEGKHRRKVSLMPPVTEEDLWSSGMGRNDPEIVAQVFGEQFASKFRSHNISPIFEFTSYDISNPISSSTLCDPTSDLPIGLRDSNLPSGVPTVKVRVRRTSTETQNQTLNAYEDVAVALSPVTPQSNNITSPLSHENLNSLARIKGLVSQSQANNSSFNDLHIDNDLEIGAANPDIVHFQRVLNSWIKSQTKALGVAFILISNETNSLFCQVCGEELLEEAIQCGDSSLLLSFFEGQKLSASNRNEFGRKPSSEPETKPVVKDLKDLSTTFAKSLYEIAGRLTGQELACTNEKDRLPDASLIAIRAHCGFCTGLLVVHRSGATKNDELGAILPHLPMIGTLMSIVANIEEQKRLARQSQIFLSMAQNVFSSL
uniref:Uncharacterized protein n=1 Tax=Acrobeloides nanus TaxID=290746 RepID=A0A914DHF7_9BILA